jgi:hypothetical protein
MANHKMNMCMREMETCDEEAKGSREKFSIMAIDEINCLVKAEETATR